MVVKEFDTEREMLSWLSYEENIKDLKNTFPANEYEYEAILCDRQIEVTRVDEIRLYEGL